jgi:lipopolysaccharide transport system permease protein
MPVEQGRGAAAPTVVIQPGRREAHYWHELWRYRELFVIFAWRDVAVRYKQMTLGIGWAVLRPLLTMLIFTFVFSRVARLPSEGPVPYSLMVLAGMLPWYLFASALGGAADSMVASAHLIGKIYFPRMIVPAAAAVTAFVDFTVSLLLLALLMAWHGVAPGWRLLALPAFVALAVLASLGPGLLLAALNMRYRDFRMIVPFLLQAGLYLSPVGFSTRIVPEEWRPLYGMNPMVAIIDGFRWSLLGGEGPRSGDLIACMLVTAAFLWLGVRSFRETESTFADIA